MYDDSTRTITFPHIVPNPYLTGEDGRPRRHTMNDVTGGTKRIADFGLTRNTFYGGNVAVLGLIPRYGFYACICVYNNDIMGFYVHDGAQVTEEGKRVLQRRFPGDNLVYGASVPAHADEDSAERQARLAAARARALEHGVSPDVVTHSTAVELEGLVRAMDSGTSPKPLAVEEQPPVTRSKLRPEVVVRESGTPPKPPPRRRSPVI